MSEIYKSKEFIKLQNQWYKKLAQTGFDDLEKLNLTIGNSGNVFLKKTTAYVAGKYNESTESYYSYCREFLHIGDFCASYDRFMWEMYSEGVPFRDILNKLQADGVDISLFKVFYTIKKYRKIMLDNKKLSNSVEEL